MGSHDCELVKACAERRTGKAGTGVGPRRRVVQLVRVQTCGLALGRRTIVTSRVSSCVHVSLCGVVVRVLGTSRVHFLRLERHLVREDGLRLLLEVSAPRRRVHQLPVPELKKKRSWC